jgi:hypothetical protein
MLSSHLDVSNRCYRYTGNAKLHPENCSKLDSGTKFVMVYKKKR